MTYGRRLVFVVVWLAILDQFVPALQSRVEHDLYEGSEVFRFENSDLFALGPLVDYLRDRPERLRPRVLFFGNSVIFGFGLPPASALPARFQVLDPGIRAFNTAVNGFQVGNAYLISKAVIDSIDRVYVQLVGTSVDPVLSSLIPVDDEDIAALQLERPSRLETRLRDLAGFWRLYSASYRIQAAVFGTSTKNYIYIHKGEIVRRALGLGSGPSAAPEPERLDTVVDIEAPRASAVPDRLRRERLQKRYPLLWKMEELVQGHRKRGVFLLMGEADYMGLGPSDIADLNALFAPSGEVLRVRYSPEKMTYDGLHFTAAGAERVAEALAAYEKKALANR